MLHTTLCREESRLEQKQEPRWQPTRRQLLWAGAVVAVLTIAILIGYRYGITLWDWIKLLIIPAVIAGGGLWFNTQQREREQRIADNHTQDDSLQAYLDGMSQLLTDKDLPLHSAQPGDSLSTVARARTLTVLGRLDSGRKRSVLQFLYESGLIYKEQTLLNESDLIERRHNIVSLQQAALSRANLIDAYLREADLSRANLSYTDLSRANLSEANLGWANLSEARGWTEDQLTEASTLVGATMPDGQILQGIPDGQTLQGDAVPDRPTFEEWLKSSGRKEDG